MKVFAYRMQLYILNQLICWHEKYKKGILIFSIIRKIILIIKRIMSFRERARITKTYEIKERYTDSTWASLSNTF